MPRELHLTSLAVQVRPDRLADVASSIASLPGAEIHGQAPEGKLVVVLETADDATVMARLSAIRDLEGVLGAHLVFHRIIEEAAP
jgi:nitrate reductase NapD